jgi:hypothetical protein
VLVRDLMGQKLDSAWHTTLQASNAQ